jgi:hypothetical protein
MDVIELLTDLQRRVARLEGRLAFTDPRTFIVGTAITVGMDIPPFHIGVASNGYMLDTRALYGFRGSLTAGTCTISWQLNGTEIASHAIDAATPPNELVLTDLVDVADKDLLQMVITAASGDATGLSGAFIFNTATG